LLRSELFHNEIPQAEPPSFNTRNSAAAVRTDPVRNRTPPITATNTNAPSTPSKNLFTYMSPKTGTPKSRHGPNLDTRSEVYSLSPVRYDSQKMLLSPRKQPRAVSKVPYKVLDAPDLADDFYLNLVDWGSTNILGVGLGSCVYMWNSNSGKVTKLCDLGVEDSVTSVSWIQRVCTRHAAHIPGSLTTARVHTLRSGQTKDTCKYGTRENVAGCAR
jgi:cell division cycle 20-like protein 1 (cofactor of APC complex)